MLAKIWNFLFRACKHEWKIIEKRDVVDSCLDLIGINYTLQCKKCGNIKAKRIK